MTIADFSAKTQTKKETVASWVEKGFIPGAHDDYIPDSARRPYTKARAKTGEGVIKSILKACNNEMGVCAQLYNISEPDFKNYLNGLEDGGYLLAFEADGIIYYNITARGIDFLNSNKKIKISDIVQVAQAAAAIAAVVVSV